MKNQFLESATESMSLVVSDIQMLHSELCKSNPMAAVGIRQLLDECVGIEIKINEYRILAGENK